MGASNGSAFLPLFAILGWLGLKTSWFPICAGETDVVTNVGLWKLALDLISEEEAPLGVARSLFVPIMFSVVRKKARPVLYVRLRERLLALAQALFCDLHFDGDERGNGLDESLDGLVDEQWI